jgi:RHS repeat-associated protein
MIVLKANKAFDPPPCSFVNGSLDLERESVDIMDSLSRLVGNQIRIVKIDTKTVDNDSPVSTPVPLIRYQYFNHQESACLEIDDSVSLISYEEYYPFGKSSYRSGRNQTEVQTKRYRYSGKERDDESGLYYYGARYYAAWLGRFVSTDPMEVQNPGKTPFHYALNNPVNRIEPSGNKDEENNQNDDKTMNIRILRKMAMIMVMKITKH